MSQHESQHDQTETPGGKPSQAEGSRELIEEKLGETNSHQGNSSSSQHEDTTVPAGKPSQAEGSREAAEQ